MWTAFTKQSSPTATQYTPHSTWRELLDHREQAMAKRHVAGREQWTAHTKDLPPIMVGDSLFLHNLVGNNPRRWERTGWVVQCKQFDQYSVKLDWTGKSTLRNRKHSRKFNPIPEPPLIPDPTKHPPHSLATNPDSYPGHTTTIAVCGSSSRPEPTPGPTA